MADNLKYVRYGAQEMPMTAGMTLEQAKEQMRRFFPELADPKVDTETVKGKKGEPDKTIYIFSKKAGHKGASKRHVRRKACTGKVRFATKDEAGRQAINASRAYRQKLGSYHCQFCGGYHIGHPRRPHRTRRAEFIGTRALR